MIPLRSPLVEVGDVEQAGWSHYRISRRVVVLGEGTHLTPTALPQPAETFSRSLCWLEVSTFLVGLLGDGPEDRIDVGNIGDPRGMDGYREPGRAGDDSEKDKGIQSVRERQARDKPQAVPSALNREDHDRCRNGPQGESRAWHQAKGEECATNENNDSYGQPTRSREHRCRGRSISPMPIVF